MCARTSYDDVWFTRNFGVHLTTTDLAVQLQLALVARLGWINKRDTQATFLGGYNSMASISLCRMFVLVNAASACVHIDRRVLAGGGRGPVRDLHRLWLRS